MSFSAYHRSLAFVALWLYALAAHAQPSHHKLNGPFLGQDASINLYKLSPDHQALLYAVAFGSANPGGALYCRRLDDGTNRMISDPNVDPGAPISQVIITPDSKSAVYRMGNNLYEASLTTQSALLLFNHPVGGLGELTAVEVSPDSRFVLFLANSVYTGPLELLCVELSTGRLIHLENQLPGAQEATQFIVSEDGAWVIYRALHDSSYYDLYRVPMGGGVSQKLTGGIPAGTDVVGPFFYSRPPAEPDRLVFLDEPFPYTYLNHLYSLSSAGGTPTLFDTPLDNTQSIYIPDLALTPDGRHAIYRISPVSWNPIPNFDLYSSRVADGHTVKLVDYNGRVDFQVSPDSQWVVATTHDLTSGTQVLAVQPDGGSTVTLWNRSPAPVSGVLFHPDGETVMIQGTKDGDDGPCAYRVSLTSGTSTRLFPLAQYTWGDPFLITPDGQWAVYFNQSAGNADQGDLMAAPLAGGVPRQLNPPGQPCARQPIALAPDGQSVLFVAGSLISAPIAGGAALTYDALQAIKEIQFIPESTSAICFDSTRIFLQPLGGGAPTRLTNYALRSGAVSDFALSPRGHTVAYLSDQNAPGRKELWGTDLDGGPLNLLCPYISSEPLINLLDRPIVQDSAGRDWIRFQHWGNHGTEPYYQIIPAQGGSPAFDDPTDINWRLNLPLNPAAGPGQTLVDQDASGRIQFVFFSKASANSPPLPGTRLFAADGVAQAWQEYAPVPNGFEPVPILPPPIHYDWVVQALHVRNSLGFEHVLPPISVTDGGYLQTVRFSPDGKCLVYGDGYQISEITLDYGVTTTLFAGAPPSGAAHPFITRDSRWAIMARPDQDVICASLTGAGTFQIANGSLWGSRIGLDSAISRIYYIGTGLAPGQNWLYSSTMQGDSLSVVNGTLAKDGKVRDFRIGAANDVAVYTADDAVPGEVNLFRFKPETLKLLQLNPPLGPGGSVLDFEVAPDGQTVVYRARMDASHSPELFAVSIYGGVSWRLNPSLPDSGYVRSGYKISSDSGWVAYQSDEETPGLVELFASRLTRPPPNAVGRRTWTAYR